MSRAKEMGKAVEDLSKDELVRERERCRTAPQHYAKMHHKPLWQRLQKIEARMEELGMLTEQD